VFYTPEFRIDYTCAECGKEARFAKTMFYIYVPSYGNSERWDGEKFTRLNSGALYADRKTAFSLMRELNETMFEGKAWASVGKINYK
jgi:hypothetical protein